MPLHFFPTAVKIKNILIGKVIFLLGDLLRKTREEKNLSLNDIENETKIRKLYIKAIEEGDYGKIPGEVFLKGFIKTYAKILGLDGQALVEEYKKEKNGPAAEAEKEPAAEEKQPEPEVPAEEEKPAEPAPQKADEKHESGRASILNTESNEYLKPQSSGGKKNIVILAVIIVAIIAAAAVYISSQSSDEPKAPAPSSAQTQQQEAQPQQAAPAPVSGAEVSASFADDCWTEVKVDGNVVLSETVKAGSRLTWKGAKQVDVTVGNAGAVDITFNGQPAGKLGDVGAVVTKSFAAPDAAAAPGADSANAGSSAKQQ